MAALRTIKSTLNKKQSSLFDDVLEAATQNAQLSHRIRAYTDTRTRCYVKLGWKLDKIQFAVPSKKEGHFGGGSVYIFMSIGIQVR
jgi:hypothetical protein